MRRIRPTQLCRSWLFLEGANEAVLHELRVRKALLHQENYHHSYPHCWRSKTPIIFRAMDQWFIRIDHTSTDEVSGKAGGSVSEKIPLTHSPTHSLTQEGKPVGVNTFRQQAVATIEQVKWIPDWGKSRIESAVKGRPD